MIDTNSENKPVIFLVEHLFPVALILIIAATAIPVDFRNPSLDYFSWSYNGFDIFVNILLYIPIGLTLRNKPLAYALIVFSVLTVTIEFMQLLYTNRQSSFWDIFANILGGYAGWYLVNTYHRFVDWRVQSANIQVTLLCSSFIGLLGLGLISSQPAPDSSFSDWDSSYHIAIKDELTGDRTWRGTLHAFGLFDQSLSRTQLADFSPALLEQKSLADKSGRPKPIYTLLSPEISKQKKGKPVIDSTQEKEIFNSLVSSAAMTVLAWIQPADLKQYDSARIVTFSKDQYNRNFTLAQEGGRLEFRLRTPVSGINGYNPRLLTPDILKTGQLLFVAATYDGRVSKVYLDGKLVGRLNLAAKREYGSTLFDYDAPLVSISAGVLAAIFFVSLFGSFAYGLLVWLYAPVAGFLGATFLAALGGLSALPDFTNWSLFLGMCGGMSIALVVHNMKNTDG